MMSKYQRIVVPVLGLFALTATAAIADSAAVADFHRLCIDTNANPAAALAAADAAGWTPPRQGTIDFVSLSGNEDGRVINQGTADFRAFSAGETTSGNQTIRKCAMVAQGSFDDIGAEMLRTLPVEVGVQNEQQLRWNYITLDGEPHSFDHMSVQDAVRAGQSGNPHIQIIALRVVGGAVLYYSQTSFSSSRR